MACRAATHGRVSTTHRRTLLGIVLSMLAPLSLVPAPSASADWPVYGHDLANTRDAGVNGPSLAAVSGLKQAWVLHSPSGDFTGTPVIAGGVLAAGSNTGVVYALNAMTGKLEWSRSVGAPVDGSAAIDLHAPGGAAAFVPVA